jgi:putative toxin-antitoxin system antitoxin component (TIGR02293 family)
MAKHTEAASRSTTEFLSMLDGRADWVTTSKLIRAGLPSSFFNELSFLVGLPPVALASLLGVKESARRRWLKTGKLTSTESDYVYSTALVLRSALGLFEGDQSAMREWITRPALALGQKAPVELLSTFVGINTVEAFIWKIEHGVSV